MPFSWECLDEKTPSLGICKRNSIRCVARPQMKSVLVSRKCLLQPPCAAWKVIFPFLLYPQWYLCTISRFICCPSVKGADMTWWPALCYSPYRRCNLEQVRDAHSALWECKYRDMLSTSSAAKDNLLWSANFPVDIGKVTWPLSETAEQSFSIKPPSSPSL